MFFTIDLHRLQESARDAEQLSSQLRHWESENATMRAYIDEQAAEHKNELAALHNAASDNETVWARDRSSLQRHIEELYVFKSWCLISS